MDINGDGFNDILSGCYSQSGHSAMVGSFWVLYGNKEGEFAAPVELMGTDGELLQVHQDLKKSGDPRLTENICTRPFALDWDGDGDLDIVAGNFKGTFFLFEGEGEGKFKQGPTELKDTEGKVLKITGVHSDPNFVDWDGDGDLDLVTGSSDGKVFWAENTRPGESKETASVSDKSPQLAPFKTLIEAPKEGPNYGVRIAVADLNGDGKLDILAGDRFNSGGGMKEDLTEEEQAAYQKANAAYQEAVQGYNEIWTKYRKEYEAAVKEKGEISDEDKRALYKEMVTDKANADEGMQKLRESMNTARAEMNKYQTPRVSGGHVWAYIQK